MPTDDPLETLIVRYLDRLASAGEASELDHRLATDPVARERFVLVTLMRSQLPRALRPARQRRRRRLQLAASAAAALVLVAFGALSLHWPRQPAQSSAALVQRAPRVEVVGPVTIIGARGEQPVVSGTDLAPGDELVLAGAATAIITWPQEDTVARFAGGGGRLRWQGEAQGKLLELTQGELELTVAHQSVVRPFLVRTSNAEVTVVGTRLRIEAGVTASAVAVTEGTVTVERTTDHAQVRLEAGKRCAVVADAALSAEPITPAADLIATMARTDDRWYALSGGGAQASIAAVPGPFAASAAALSVALPAIPAGPNGDEWPWAVFSVAFVEAKDWSQSRSFVCWFQGTGDGRDLRIELEGAHPPGGDAGSNPRYFAIFTDSSALWRRIELPLTGFAPRQDAPMPADPHWDRREVNAVNLVVAPARPGSWAWADLEVRR